MFIYNRLVAYNHLHRVRQRARNLAAYLSPERVRLRRQTVQRLLRPVDYRHRWQINIYHIRNLTPQVPPPRLGGHGDMGESKCG